MTERRSHPDPTPTSLVTMADKEKILNNVKLLLSCILTSEKYGLDLDRLEKSFEEFEGYNIPYGKMGFTRPQDFFREIQDAVAMSWGPDGKLHLDVIANEKNARVRRLVEKQRDPAPKRSARGRGWRWRGGRGRGRGPPLLSRPDWVLMNPMKSGHVRPSMYGDPYSYGGQRGARGYHNQGQRQYLKPERGGKRGTFQQRMPRPPRPPPEFAPRHNATARLERWEQKPVSAPAERRPIPSAPEPRLIPAGAEDGSSSEEYFSTGETSSKTYKTAPAPEFIPPPAREYVPPAARQYVPPPAREYVRPSEERQSNYSPSVPQSFKTRILDLLIGYPNGLFASSFESVYQRRYQQALSWEDMGFSSCREMLVSLSDLIELQELPSGAVKIHKKRLRGVPGMLVD